MLLSSMAAHPKGTSYGDAEASPSGRSTQRQGDKRSAAADLIASNAPLREGRHTARQNGPKHYPRGFKGIAIPLARLSPLSFVVQRQMGPPEVVGVVERLVQNVQSKMGPPEVASCRARPVKTQNKNDCAAGDRKSSRAAT